MIFSERAFAQNKQRFFIEFKLEIVLTMQPNK
jgi:hypothetical protein